MRGYLQRMAASVLTRERAIHPAVGSRWAPQSGMAPIEESGQPLSPGLRPHIASDAEADRSQTQTQANLHPEPERTESNRVAKEQSPTMQPNASVSINGTEMRLPLPPENASASEQIHLAQIHSSPIGKESGQQTEQSQSERSIFTPLLPESAHQPVAAQNPAIQASAPPHSAAQRSHPVAQPTHQPDTIEIHIGRIEVLAAQPQPAQRPPARPAHKSLDLREYLGRGGRTR